MRAWAGQPAAHHAAIFQQRAGTAPGTGGHAAVSCVHGHAWEKLLGGSCDAPLRRCCPARCQWRRPPELDMYLCTCPVSSGRRATSGNATGCWQAAAMLTLCSHWLHCFTFLLVHLSCGGRPVFCLLSRFWRSEKRMAIQHCKTCVAHTFALHRATARFPLQGLGDAKPFDCRRPQRPAAF